MAVVGLLQREVVHSFRQSFTKAHCRKSILWIRIEQPQGLDVLFELLVAKYPFSTYIKKDP